MDSILNGRDQTHETTETHQEVRPCARCDGEGCDGCGGMGRIVDDEPEEPGP